VPPVLRGRKVGDLGVVVLSPCVLGPVLTHTRQTTPHYTKYTRDTQHTQ
jgi:hypothetical protein